MKKLLKSFLLMAAVVTVLGICKAQAADYSVALTTYVPTAGAAQYAQGSYPNIAGNTYPRTFILANAGATAQDVTVYDTCTSSAAAKTAIVFSLPAAIGTYQYNLVGQLWKNANPCFTKSSVSSAVQLSVLYQ